MTPLEAYEAAVTRGARPEHAARVAAMRKTFEERTGAFSPDDAWFEVRGRAFWDDALTRQRFAVDVAAELPAEAREWTRRFAAAHRGLFVVVGGAREKVAGGMLLRDVWGGAEFVLHEMDDSMRASLAAAAAPFDARLVASTDPVTVTILPGALFHPPDAIDAISAVLVRAREKQLGTDDALDALMHMERRLRSLSRVKAAYAYSPGALEKPKRRD